MLRSILTAVLLLAASAAAVRAEMPATAFPGKLKPDVLGVSTDDDAAAAAHVLGSYFKDRADVKSETGQQAFGTGGAYTASLDYHAPAAADHAAETLRSAFSSPASANRAYFVSRRLSFATDREPVTAEFIQQILDKHGKPTLIGAHHIYYFYRAGKLVRVGQKYDLKSATEALGKPLNGRAALALNDDKGRGSCVGVLKRIEPLAKTLAALSAEAKAANCEGALAVELVPGKTAGRVATAQFTLVDFKRIVSAARIDTAPKSGVATPPAGPPRL